LFLKASGMASVEGWKMTEIQSTWGWLVAFYLFLGGLGAGAAVAVAVTSLASGERFKSTVHFGAWASAIAIGVGTLLLLIDVGKPFRAVVLFRSFVNFSSWMTIGAWLLFSAILLNGLFALFWTGPVLDRLSTIWKPLKEKRRIFQIVLAAMIIPVNLGVAVYTGVLLGVLPFRALWHTWLLPSLFTASALDTGVGLVTGYATLRERAEGVKKLRLVLEACVIALVAIEGTVLGFYLSALLHGSDDAARSVQMLISGPLAVAFWVVVVGLGLGIPLAVCITQLSGVLKKQATLVVPSIGLASCLVGGWTLRFLVLSAGLPQALSSPALQQILQGSVRFLP
jgi:formate-dependent nitrite reductase membrane component NrfD